MTLLTVVTIGRNNLDGMQRTFASLASQTYRDVQHVVIDGNSSDRTEEWVRQHPAFSNMTVVSEPDDGIFDAMNKGLALADGRVVCFLNSGDCFAKPDVLERAAASYLADGWKWAFGLFLVVNEIFEPVRRQQTRRRYSWVLTTFWNYNVSHQTVFMETEILRGMGGFDARFSLAADYHTNIRVGRLYRPTLWPWTVALTLEGGASLASSSTSLWQCHAARVDVFRMNRVVAGLDATLTAIVLSYAHLRRLIRLALGSTGRRATLRYAANAELLRSTGRT